MKNLFIFLFIALFNLNSNAQASWNTQFAFILRDENSDALNLESFKKSYLLINVNGENVSDNDLIHYLTYDEKTNYFILNIETIGPRFSFALIHNNELMVICLPFSKSEHIFYALDFKFRSGKFLFDFKIKDQKKIYLKNNIPLYKIKKINWNKQSKKLKKSGYSEVNTYQSTQQ